MTVASATRGMAKRAVVTAVGVAAEILSEAASAIRNITREALSDSNDISADSICAAAW